ncbi:lycopene cyclase domain-containing protein [Arcticibacterium luteifluviistationis]|uniref:Lycopene cyclase domain-containing protein n=1 Tax=Arcticibacterium luteifluviistationis TaxID=1784714 RepID=A0A2Z4GD54_9BACT|nr:lycopene cyclase domain-containing protein [Arcticibacterium luteifluviistationis]AWV99018.1 lycopene cyclase domain-containing protein [Arcticibacterium luteifluviistationis]
MNWLYFLLNIGSLSIPFLYSFHPKMNFIRHWKAIFKSSFIIAVIFIIWDVIFTKNAVWGFNPNYHLGIELWHLPFEEILFFFCIPYASIFIHYSLEYFIPKVKLSLTLVKAITITLAVLAIFLSIKFSDRAYTFVNFSFFLLVLIISWFTNLELLRRFYLSFLIILIPFFIVNGILTGSFIESPVVWYNNDENLGIRLFTVPVEDTAYAFSMIFSNLMLMKYFSSKKPK